MSKITIDYIVKTASLLLLALFLFALYIHSSASGFMYLLAGGVAVAMLALYNVMYFSHSSVSRKKPASGHIKPRKSDTVNHSLKPIQVSAEDQEKINIGKNYYFGRGLPKDFEKAFAYLFDGALSGSAEAQMLVGKMFLFGQGVRQNAANACTWLEASSFQGNVEAEYLLGRFYSNRDDDKVSMVKAFYFLQRAASMGNEEARIRLREISKNQHLTGSLNKVPDEVFFDIDHNPFIQVFSSQKSRQIAPRYSSPDVKKAFELLGLAPTNDLEQIHRKYLSLMLKLHPDRNTRNSSAKNILAVRQAYDILENFINSSRKTEHKE